MYLHIDYVCFHIITAELSTCNKGNRTSKAWFIWTFTEKLSLSPILEPSLLLYSKSDSKKGKRMTSWTDIF